MIVCGGLLLSTLCGCQSPPRALHVAPPTQLEEIIIEREGNVLRIYRKEPKDGNL